MRVLVTGAAGLLGTWLRRTAAAGTTVVPLVHRRSTGDPAEVHVDLRDAADTGAALAAAGPDLVIHAAYAKEAASIVAATRHLADAATAVGSALVHISTDSVFAGDGRPRAEDETPDPVSDYGRWKTAAERIATERTAGRAAIVRLPLIVSLDPPDHAVAKIADGARSGRPTTWFTDEVRQPAMAADLAAAIWRIAGLPGSRRAGAWHLMGPERLTRHQIALRVVAALDLPTDVLVAAARPDDDRRPRDLYLRDDRARREIGWAAAAVLP